MSKNNLSASDYALECWEQQFGSRAVQQVAHADWSEPYEVDSAHVFKLLDGKFAVVIERGCSCYDYSDADITVVSTKEEALRLFQEGRGNKS
jgi:hypothetical protein